MYSPFVSFEGAVLGLESGAALAVAVVVFVVEAVAGLGAVVFVADAAGVGLGLASDVSRDEGADAGFLLAESGLSLLSVSAGFWLVDAEAGRVEEIALALEDVRGVFLRASFSSGERIFASRGFLGSFGCMEEGIGFFSVAESVVGLVGAFFDCLVGDVAPEGLPAAVAPVLPEAVGFVVEVGRLDSGSFLGGAARGELLAADVSGAADFLEAALAGRPFDAFDVFAASFEAAGFASFAVLEAALVADGFAFAIADFFAAGFSVGIEAAAAGVALGSSGSAAAARGAEAG